MKPMITTIMKTEELLEPLEIEAMKLLLAGDHPVLERLRSQIPNITAVTRRFTGGGFYTTFELAEDAPILPGSPKFDFGDVAGAINDLRYGAAFMLYVEGGKLRVLEGYTFSPEAWPSAVTKFKLGYSNDARNWTELNRMFATFPPVS
jgi:hypothetical protein